MSVTGVVAALPAEARTLGTPIRRRQTLSTLRDGTLVAVSGMGAVAAAEAARALIDAGATGLVSWGMAGGLDPQLIAGTICLPNLVVAESGAAFTTDPHWRELMAAAIGGGYRVVAGRLLTSRVAIPDLAGKAAAFCATGATAVDMESLAIAGVAAVHRLPFIAIRVIVDTAADALPAAVLTATREGQVRILPLLVGILRSPGTIRPLLELAGRYRVAMRALAAVARTGALAPLALAASAPSRIA